MAVNTGIDLSFARLDTLVSAQNPGENAVYLRRPPAHKADLPGCLDLPGYLDSAAVQLGRGVPRSRPTAILRTDYTIKQNVQH